MTSTTSHRTQHHTNIQYALTPPFYLFWHLIHTSTYKAQAAAARGLPPMNIVQTCKHIVKESGVKGLFQGDTLFSSAFPLQPFHAHSLHFHPSIHSNLSLSSSLLNNVFDYFEFFLWFTAHLSICVCVCVNAFDFALLQLGLCFCGLAIVYAHFYSCFHLKYPLLHQQSLFNDP